MNTFGIFLIQPKMLQIKQKSWTRKRKKAEKIANENDPKKKLDKTMQQIENEIDGTNRKGEKVKPQAGRSDSVKGGFDKILNRNQRLNDAILHDKF